MKILYTTEATVEGGRRGNVDVMLRVDGTELRESDSTNDKAGDNREQDTTSGAAHTQG